MDAITWTPVTYYVAIAVIQMIVILLGFRAMQVDPENNTFVGAVLAAAVIGVTGYFTRDLGVIGVMIVSPAIFVSLVVITSGEALKSAIMSLIMIAVYGLGGTFFLEPDTPLTLEEVNGLTKVVMTGGLEAEPMTEGDAEKMMKGEVPKPEDE